MNKRIKENNERQIIVRNSHIEIQNYNGNSKLERLLSVWDDKAHKISMTAFIKKGNSLIIPSGFNISYLQTILNSSSSIPYKIKYTSKTDPFDISIIKMTVPPRDNRQIEAEEFLSGQKDFIKFKECTEKIVAMGTSIGKTYCSIRHIAERKVKALIIVDKKTVKNQWVDEFLKFTNISIDDIYFISGRASINKLMKEKNPKYKIYIAIHKTLKTLIDDENEPELITDLFNHMKVGIKIIDEFHIYFENIIQINLRTNTMESVYLSATPGRTKDRENRLFFNCFNNVPTYGFDIKWDIDELYVQTYFVIYNSYPSGEDLARSKNYYGFDLNFFSKYSFQIKGHIVLKYLYDMIDMFTKKDLKTAIIVHTLDQVKILKNYLCEIYEENEIGLFCSLTAEKDMKKEAEKSIIITTEKSLGSAITIPDLRALIMTVPTSSPIVIKQVLGRLRNINKTCYFTLFTDYGFEACRTQKTKIKSYIEEQSKKVFLLDLRKKNT